MTVEEAEIETKKLKRKDVLYAALLVLMWFTALCLASWAFVIGAISLY